MKSAILIIAAISVIFLLGGVLDATTDFRTTSTTETYDVTTGANVTSTAIVLVHELWNDETLNATVTSNDTGDAPIAYSYVSATRTLTVTGLDASISHRLYIEYLTAGLDDYPGTDVSAKMWPLFIILGVLGLIAAAVIAAVRRGE